MAKHHRKHKASGGEADFGKPRVDEDPSPKEVYAGKGSNVEHEADEKKHGGMAKRKRKHGGHVKIHKHHEKGEHMKHAKHLGHVKGEMHHPHPGHMRRERKDGGRAGSNFHPLSSAHGGTNPRDHKVHEID